MVKILVGVFGVLLFCVVVVYVNMRPSGPELPDDPLALEALTMVRTHPARQAPNLEQAIANILETMEKKGQPFRRGEWRVAPSDPDVFVVSLLIREKGETGWIERDYAWRVNVKEKWIKVITLPAIGIMPFHELPPLFGSEGVIQNGLFPRLRRQLRAQILMYFLIHCDLPRGASLHTKKSSFLEAPFRCGDKDLYSPVYNSDLIRGNGPCLAGIFKALSGSNIKLPPMPWTGDAVSFQGSFSQRTASMRTGIV